MFWTNPHPLRSWPFSKLSCWRFDFFPRKFAACSKPPSRDNYRKASYPGTQQRNQGAGWTHDPTIRVVVKTTPYFVIGGIRTGSGVSDDPMSLWISWNSQVWKSRLFKSKDESISIVHTKSKELSIVDIRNKKQRLKKQKAKIAKTKSKDYSNRCRNSNKVFYYIFY